MRPRSRYHDCDGSGPAADPLDRARREAHRREPGRHTEALLRARVHRVDPPAVDVDRDPAERRDGVDQQQRVGLLQRGERRDRRSRHRSTSPRARPRARARRDAARARRATAAGRSRGPRLVDPHDLAPQRRATSHMRSPNTPLTPMMTVSPGSSRLTKHASMPADPVPLIGSVSAFSVRKTRRSRSAISSSTSRNSGSRCPSTGRWNASITSGYGFDGPGPSSSRSE